MRSAGTSIRLKRKKCANLKMSRFEVFNKEDQEKRALLKANVAAENADAAVGKAANDAKRPPQEPQQLTPAMKRNLRRKEARTKASTPKELKDPNKMTLNSKARGPLRKEAFRTLLSGHLIPDLAGIALDYFLVLMFVRIIHLAR